MISQGADIRSRLARVFCAALLSAWAFLDALLDRRADQCPKLSAFSAMVVDLDAGNFEQAVASAGRGSTLIS